MKKNNIFSGVISLHFYISLLLVVLLAVGSCAEPKSNDLSDNDPEGLNNEASVKITLPLAFNLPFEVRETSGLVFYNGKLWTHNDSNHLPIIYAIDTATAEVVNRITLTNAVNVDWEEITMDDTYLYIGDFGNNRGTRTDLGIYRIPLEYLHHEGDVDVEAAYIGFSYPDQTSFESGNSHNFDCEAFIAYNDNLYLFSKNRGDQHTKLYRLPAQPGTYVADLIDTFNSKGLITGSTLHADGNELVLVGYVNQIWTPFIWIMDNFEAPDFFGGNHLRLDIIDLVATQIEAVCYYDEKQLFISSEQRPGANPRLFRLDLEAFKGDTSKESQDTGIAPDNPYIMKELLAEKKLQFNVQAEKAGHAQMSIEDSYENIMHEESILLNHPRHNWFLFDLQHLPSGEYILNIKMKQKRLSQNFVLP